MFEGRADGTGEGKQARRGAWGLIAHTSPPPHGMAPAPQLASARNRRRWTWAAWALLPAAVPLATLSPSAWPSSHVRHPTPRLLGRFGPSGSRGPESVSLLWHTESRECARVGTQTASPERTALVTALPWSAADQRFRCTRTYLHSSATYHHPPPVIYRAPFLTLRTLRQASLGCSSLNPQSNAPLVRLLLAVRARCRRPERLFLPARSCSTSRSHANACAFCNPCLACRYAENLYVSYPPCPAELLGWGFKAPRPG